MIDVENAKEISIRRLLTQHRYTIPIYQRNYAWKDTEITQLINDIWDACKENSKKNYYIGSLVVAKQHGVNVCQQQFEIIDGQQRHTTLIIIAAALKTLLSKFKEPPIVLTSNLDFNCRQSSSNTLRYLFESTLDDSEFLSLPPSSIEPSIEKGYKIALKRFKELNSHENANFLTYFHSYFFNNVLIARIIVPEETDLNHYFEIMNTRGKQLEKHEILKARFMGKLNDHYEQKTLAIIWDACANMQRYAIMNVPEALRKVWFGNAYQRVPSDFSTLVSLYKQSISATDTINTKVETASLKLIDIIKSSKIPVPHPQKTTDKATAEEGKQFESIIDFPSFLVQILSIAYHESDISLDDKKILELFETNILNKSNSPSRIKRFIYNLLKIRLIFDKYIIKRNNQEWSLSCINKSHHYSHTFDSTLSSTPSVNTRLIMLQAMFHFSFPSNNHKNWLQATLHYIVNRLFNNNHELFGDNYINFLEHLARNYLLGQLKIDTNTINVTLEALHQGTSMHNFIFNYLDYHLWKTILSEDIRFMINKDMNEEDKKYFDITAHAKKFRFTFRSSIEHYWPQHPINDKKLDTKGMKADNFSNLCLISHNQNSRLSNHLPSAKKDYYKKSASTESLKQVLMMRYAHWAYSNDAQIEKGIDNMKHHLNAMIQVLNNSLKITHPQKYYE